MPNYNTPGVYVEEIPTLPASVAQVETAVPAFIGHTEKAEKDGESIKLIPTRITSMLEYEKYFGGPQFYKGQNFTDGIFVEIADYTVPELPREITVKKSSTKYPKHTLYQHLQMFFANGGGACYIVSADPFKNMGTAITASKLEEGLNALAKVDEPTLILFPEAVEITTAGNFYSLYGNALDQSAALGDRFTIMDVHKQDTDKLRDTLSSDNLKYGAVYHPFLNTTLHYPYKDEDVIITKYTIDGVDQNDGLFEKSILLLKNEKDENDLDNPYQNLEDYNKVKTEIAKKITPMTLPPCSAIAGVYARVDSTRGVWKAPANVSLKNVISTDIKITDEMQGGLNIDPQGGKSINAIRSFTGKGVMVWGARTLAGNDNEWRYVSVRRLFNMVEESVKKTTSWAVFENNDANSWMKIKSQIENFLTSLWREGALAGAKPDEAFFVNAGLGTTMTPQDILEGKMNVEIGMASVRPAEFIILKFSHMLQQS